MDQVVSKLSYGSMSCDIDLQSPGKRFANISMSHSDHRHAFSAIQTPIAVIKGGEGPTVLLSAGNHGDEYEGQCLLRRLIHSLEPGTVNGRLIILPALNSPAVRAATRTSPLDNGNLNRSFPGEANSGPTKAIAGFLVKNLFPLADFAVDFHSGGSTATYVDTGFLCASRRPEIHNRNVELMEMFGAPFTMVVPPGDTGTDIDSSAHQSGLPLISCELGGAGTVSPTSLNVGWSGLMRVLFKNGVLPQGHPLLEKVDMEPTATRFVDLASNSSMVTASFDGLFEPLYELGSWVTKGDKAGALYGLHNIVTPLEVPAFLSDGVVVIKKRDALARSGDHLYCVAGELTREQVIAIGA